MFPGVKRSIHFKFTDSVSVSGTGEEIMDILKIRDGIIQWIDEHVKEGGILPPLNEDIIGREIRKMYQCSSFKRKSGFNSFLSSQNQ